MEDVPTSSTMVEMSYDPEVLCVCDLAAQDYEIDMMSDGAINHNITVISHDENVGKIRFEIDSNVMDEQVFGGALTVMVMKAMADGDTEITLTAV